MSPVWARISAATTVPDTVDSGELGARLGHGGVQRFGRVVDPAIEPAKFTGQVDGDLAESSAVVFPVAHRP